MTRVLVVGGDGTVGRALVSALVARGDAVISTTRRGPFGGPGNRMVLDLSDPAALDAGLPAVDVAVICAAVARYSDCRENPTLARRVNVTMPERITSAMAACGGRTILLSTSAVFDCLVPHRAVGSSRAPSSAYGRMKAEAEVTVLAHAPYAAVLRLTKLVSPGMTLLIGWMRALERKETVCAFSDLTISPLGVEETIAAILAIIDDDSAGIYQISGARDINYAEIARYLARRLGVDESLVHSELAVDNGIPAGEVTRFTSMRTDRLSALTGFTPPQPEDVLDRLLVAYRACP